MPRRKTKGAIRWEKAEDIHQEIKQLVSKADIQWVNLSHIHCVRSYNSTARAYARIWGMGRIWQETLGIPAAYCIEVISEKFDPLPKHKQEEVLLHEIAHIPRNFSGALVPHTHRGKGNFHDKLRGLINAYRRG